MSSAPLLDIAGIEAGYGTSRVLFGVDLSVAAGSAVALLGRNGMGKTTTIRAALGLLPATAGRVRFAGRDVTGQPAHRIARLGIGLVPEGRQIFPNLTVRENLVATARAAPGGWTIARVHDLFPRLGERAGNLGSELSGGEQQMLAIGRALMTNPRLLVLDEATEGLAPLIRREIWAALERLRAGGLAILVVDKDVAALARLCDHHAVIERGRIVWRGSASDLLAAPEVAHRHLGLGAPGT
ncbi:ABC transporter ATP-binding protein [Stella sp.]|uniref:ABC transporter ATP-binding protein n=1 Tax=Stella sp. TaxID=2912054 RepID=UPI0035AF0521